MRITVLGGLGASPTARQGCSGYVLEDAGFRLLVDPGYATIQPLLDLMTAAAVDAVWVSHGHPDHCADLQPLLRIRTQSTGAGTPPASTAALPIFAPVGALAPLLSLDQPGMVDDAYVLHEVADGDKFAIGPWRCMVRTLPHMVPNLGIRIWAGDGDGTSDGATVAYTGDCGPSDAVAELARDADLLIANATFPDEVPGPRAANLSTARQAGAYARAAGARSLLLTHQWPGLDPAGHLAAAGREFDGPIHVATPNLVILAG